jgi:mRNA-degrading endonuclease RelE of RelBE toxin-antitoxin system
MGRPLAGVLKGERSFHFGRKPEYRLIYYIEKSSIIITALGSREAIYKKAKRRK